MTSSTPTKDPLRNEIKAGGPFPPESGRYHLYIGHFCPWAHRTTTVIALKGLEAAISVSAVHPLSTEAGLHFSPQFPDPIQGRSTMAELYRESDPGRESNFSVPVLYDKKSHRIVNNDSSEIVRLLNSQFNEWAKRPELDLYPAKSRAEVDELNSWIHPSINAGVYKVARALEQSSFDTAFGRLFAALERLERLLAEGRRFLAGVEVTEADVRLFTTVVRFDAVHVGLFRTNLKRVAEFAQLQRWLVRMLELPGVAATVRMDQIKFYYYSHPKLVDKRRPIPAGPELPWYKGSSKWDPKWFDLKVGKALPK